MYIIYICVCVYICVIGDIEGVWSWWLESIWTKGCSLPKGGWEGVRRLVAQRRQWRPKQLVGSWNPGPRNHPTTAVSKGTHPWFSNNPSFRNPQLESKNTNDVAMAQRLGPHGRVPLPRLDSRFRDLITWLLPHGEHREENSTWKESVFLKYLILVCWFLAN
jgi:hypothetical protein